MAIAKDTAQGRPVPALPEQELEIEREEDEQDYQVFDYGKLHTSTLTSTAPSGIPIQHTHLGSIHEDEYAEYDYGYPSLDFHLEIPKSPKAKFWQRKIMASSRILPRVLRRSRDEDPIEANERHYYDRALNTEDDDLDVADMEGQHAEKPDADERLDLVDEQVVHILSRSRLRAARARRTICCISLLGCVLLLTGITVNTIHSPPHLSIAKPQATQPQATQPNPANKQKLNSLCAIDNLQTRAGMTACRDACTVASCCHTDILQDNCYADFKSFCSDYIACNILKDGPDIPDLNDQNSAVDDNASPPTTLQLQDAPFNLDFICNPEAMKTQATTGECQDECEPAKCCFPSYGAINPDANCFNDHPELCMGYSTCEHIYHEPVGPPSSTIPQEIPDDDVSVDNTSSPVWEACQPSKINQDETAKQICVELCSSFQCCFVSLPKIGMCNQDPGCAGWGAPCKVLYTSSSSSSTSTKFDSELLREIKDACSPSSFTQTADQCEDLCAPSMCCFQTPANGGCNDQSWCDRYQDCKIILDDTPDYKNVDAVIHQDAHDTYVDGMSLDDISDMVFELCERIGIDLTQPEDRKDCTQACAPSDCCFLSPTDAKSCVESTPDICEAFSACSKLRTTQGTIDSDDNSVDAKLEWHTNMVKDLCQDNFNKQDCLQVCWPAECCFQQIVEGGANTCPSDFDCDPFYDCNVLIGNSAFAPVNGKSSVDLVKTDDDPLQDDIIRSKVVDACTDLSKDSPQTTNCLQVCELAECCFDTCDEQPKIRSCTPYEQCQALVGIVDGWGNNKSDSLFDDIYDKCQDADLTQSDLRLPCAQACKQAKCCFEPSENYCGEEEWCKAYKPCSNLLTTSIAGEGETSNDNDTDGNDTDSPSDDSITDAVKSSCSAPGVDLTNPNDRMGCAQVCKVAKCCFEENNDDCTGSESWCNPYKDCEALLRVPVAIPDEYYENYTGDEANKQVTDGMLLTGQINNMCVTASEDCMNICWPSECCFNNAIECSDNMLGCDPYAACEILLETTDFAKSDDNTPTTTSAIDGMLLTGKVERLCQDVTYATAREDCLDVCLPAECCFNTDISCAPGLIGCDPYEACDVLLETTNFARTDKKDNGNTSTTTTGDKPFVDGMLLTGRIERLCGDDEDIRSNSSARKDCLDACLPAECCFNNKLPCDSDLIGCDPYDACEVLLGITDFADSNTQELGETDTNTGTDTNTESEDNDSNMKSTPMDGTTLTGKVEAACDIENLGHEDCIDICLPAECCFNTEVECGDDLLGCDPYQACKVLLDITNFGSISGQVIKLDGTVEMDGMRLTGKVEAACQDISDDAGINECKAICLPAQCCFNTDIPCNSDLIGCDPYDLCGILLDDTDYAKSDASSIMPATPTSSSDFATPFIDGMKLTGKVEAVCQDNFDKEDCLDICKPSECCFNNDIPCSKGLLGCDPYDACDVLLDISDFAKGDKTTNDSDQQPNEQTTSSSSYNPIVVEPTNGGKVDPAVAEACDPDNWDDKEGVEICEDACGSRECCFVAESWNCYSDATKDWCEQYSPCRNVPRLNNPTPGSLNKDTTSTKSKTSQSSSITKTSTSTNSGQDKLILNVCSSENLATKSGLDACREACGFRACCFSPEEEDNCYQDNIKWCDAYAACKDPMQGLFET